MGRRSVEQAPGPGDAARPPGRAPRELPAAWDRPISTGNLLADCERWCRDHLPRREPRSPDATRVVDSQA
ncbi:hypothetical protein ACI79D_05845 [Geodermatophilus sp. SYSU D00708]